MPIPGTWLVGRRTRSGTNDDSVICHQKNANLFVKYFSLIVVRQTAEDRDAEDRAWRPQGPMGTSFSEYGNHVEG